MKKTVIFIVLIMMIFSGCNVLQGDIEGNVQINGNDYSTDSNGSVIISTPSTETTEKPNTDAEFTNTPGQDISETEIPTPTESKPTEKTTIEPTVKPTEKPTVTPETPDPSENLTGENILGGLRICIDAGHQIKGNYDKERCAPWNDDVKSKCTSGTTGNYTGVEEYVMNLEIANKIKASLESYGAQVLMVRESHEVDISNKERAEMANEFGADVTLRIHGNSCDTPSVEGMELFVRDKGDGSDAYLDKSNKDYKIAESLLNYICKATGAVSRGVKKSDAYTGINWCEGTCIIVECGFMSNEKEDKLLNSDDYQQKIADGITNYFISVMS